MSQLGFPGGYLFTWTLNNQHCTKTVHENKVATAGTTFIPLFGPMHSFLGVLFVCVVLYVLLDVSYLRCHRNMKSNGIITPDAS